MGALFGGDALIVPDLKGFGLEIEFQDRRLHPSAAEISTNSAPWPSRLPPTR
jgi:hypothetical protein